MSWLGKSVLAMVIPSALALTVPGTAHAARDLHGAIATSPAYGGVGEAFDYPNQEAADEAALEACRKSLAPGKPGNSCVVIIKIQNECGSVVETDLRYLLVGTVGPQYSFGKGATAAEAEQKARHQASFYRDNWPFTLIEKPSFVLDTICTSNTR